MSFKQYRRLRGLIERTSSFGEFIEEVGKWRRYAIINPVNWTKANYAWFYNRIKGGAKYVNLYHDAKAA